MVRTPTAFPLKGHPSSPSMVSSHIDQTIDRIQSISDAEDQTILLRPLHCTEIEWSQKSFLSKTWGSVFLDLVASHGYLADCCFGDYWSSGAVPEEEVVCISEAHCQHQQLPKEVPWWKGTFLYMYVPAGLYISVFCLYFACRFTPELHNLVFTAWNYEWPASVQTGGAVYLVV